MNFCDVLMHAMLGKTIVSNIGNRYTIDDLRNMTFGSKWFNIPSTTSMTKSEREGKWRVE